jgi:hypothetical protein
MKPFWIWRRHATRTHQIGSQRITPVVQSIGLRWRGGGWLWQFPLAIDLQDETTGTQEHVPVPDPTRMILWFLYTLTFVVIITSLMILWQGRQQSKASQERLNHHV